ncbi:NAD(P)/FAD-dependent oxidoreductase [Patescibacteria group bacterium]|nr:NAD(P)/FAD-dependent oxidoreductase [Patescibacteria group bacterium]
MNNKYDTIVVGGGIAGLTSASYVSKSGQKVLLIEKNKECGGLVNTFERDGFHFDVGVRALEDAGIIKPMLKDLGIEIEFVKSPVSLGIEDEIINIDNIESLEKYKELLLKFYPESESEIDEIIKNIKNIMKHMDVLYGIENPLFKDLKRDTNFIFKKLLPWLPRFLLTIVRINSMRMPVEKYLKTFVRNSSLRDIISQHFFRNTPTFFAMSYFSLYLDYFYPKGGVGKITDAMEKKILERGGEIKKETKIVKVDANKHLLKDQGNITYEYNNLIWAADLKTLYRIVKVDNSLLKNEKVFENTKKHILESRGGDSVFSFFLEVDEPLESFKRITNGHLFYTPSKQGLGQTHRGDLQNLLENFENLSKEEIYLWLDKFTKLNTYEISIPGLKYPGMVPKGKTGLIISILAEYDLFKKIQEAGWIDNFVSELEKDVLNVISNSIFPMLKEKIIKQFSFTPLSIENRVGSSEGGITGWAFEKDMPVVNKLQLSSTSVLTSLPSIYQAGQWSYSPAGVPMSILTGKIAADKVV